MRYYFTVLILCLAHSLFSQESGVIDDVIGRNAQNELVGTITAPYDGTIIFTWEQEGGSLGGAWTAKYSNDATVASSNFSFGTNGPVVTVPVCVYANQEISIVISTGNGNEGAILDYRIEWQFNQPTYQEDVEPNNDASEAIPTVENNIYQGQLQGTQANPIGADSEDWYSFTMPRTGDLKITIQNPEESSLTGRAQIQLYTSNIQLRTQNSRADEPTQYVYLYLEGTLNPIVGDTYYIRVNGGCASYALSWEVLGPTTDIPDPNFEQALINLGIDSGSVNGSVPTASIENISVLDVSASNITSLTGIEDFSALQQLTLNSNNLTLLNLPSNTNLTSLQVDSNPLTSVTLTQNNLLQNLIISNSLGDSFTSINLNGNTALTSVNISGNDLNGPVPDLSGNVGFTSLNISGNDYQFGDIEPVFTNYQTIPQFIYSPQQAVSEDVFIAPTLGDSETLSVTVSGANNNYQWFKDGVVLNGETNTSLVLNNIQPADFGVYHCEITNTLVTGLTLLSGTFSLSDNPDLEALIAFYNATGGDNWTNNTNWLSSEPVSTWYGVTVNANNKVIVLDLFFNNLVGNLPAEIGQFSELETLFLPVNSLSGTIPTSIGNLINLQEFSLSSNQFTGEIPTQIGNLSNLRSLFLGTNMLTGIIPTTITGLVNLENFQVFDNDLSGPIPDFTGNTNLEFLRIENNNFVFGDFETQFNAYQNNLTFFNYAPQSKLSDDTSLLVNVGGSVSLNATVPGTANTYQWYRNGEILVGATSAILNINPITLMDLGTYYCEVTNSIVTGLTLETGVTTLEVADAQTNALVAFYHATGGPNWTNNTNWLTSNPLDTWFGLDTDVNGNVNLISISNNNLVGELPSEIGDFPELKILRFMDNDISGQIPSTIGNLLSIEELRFDNNDLVGPIPPQIGNLTNLVTLEISDTQVSGPIPPEIMSCVNLRNLIIFRTDIEGPIPSNIDQLQNLENLLLFQNPNLNGEIPSELGNIPSLTVLFMENNDFTGLIPESLTNLPSIHNLNVQNNNLFGFIPDFTGTTIQFLSINGNRYAFGDIEPNFNFYFNNLNNFNYSPQQMIFVPEAVQAELGSTVVLEAGVSGVNNTYRWTKNGVTITGETNSTLVLSNIQQSDYATYLCSVQNTLVLGFSLPSKNYFVEDSDVDLGLKVFLEGPATSQSTPGLMNDNLRITGAIPTTSPYADAISCEPSVFNVVGADAMVDWIWLELRDENDSNIILSNRSALLQRDGDVVESDGITPIGFNVPAGNYFISIAHRNHLGILSAQPVSLSFSNTPNLDFTNDIGAVFGGNNAIATLPNGDLALYSGDFDGDGQIQNSDRLIVESLRGVSGYSNADIDGNGEVQNTDINISLIPNLGKGVQFMNRQLQAKRRN